ncbi:unnamed protein product [Brassicogethes aeneus]|uniref:Peroxisomal membrane protein PMP34 n=1 Tax=Brassicogethes aeneus TaxID=1431903 RepID=A0A9P0FEU4_BRAAE|nr:unnamed protein product [Brassicogethes aeneus]
MGNGNLFNYETLVHATAGATGSVIASACIYPLDNLKFRLQANEPALIEKPTIEALLYLLKTEGLESWYRGLKPVLTSMGVSNFIYFYSFHGFKSLMPKNYQITSKTDLAFSIASGIINVLLTTPLWVVNSRLKVNNKENYSGLLDGLVHIGCNEGFGSLWSGVGASLVLVINPAIHFTVYEAFKRKVTLKSAYSFFLLGALSKSVATVLTYPLQLAQTRQRLNKQQNIYTLSLLLSILKKDGPGALYQGLETKLLQTVLAAALMFMTYEKVSRLVFMLLLRQNKLKQ